MSSVVLSVTKVEYMSHEDYPDQWLLARRYDLEPRRWQLPTGEIVGEAINREAIELLKSDPDEYFRRSRRYVAHRERDE